MYLICGLGNPGSEYEHTRHNVGRSIVSHLHEREHGTSWSSDKLAQAHCAHVPIADADTMFVLPDTYMNRSGETVAYLARAQNARPEDFIVVHDDIDLPLGVIRVAHRRGDGGHNGLKSVIASLKSNDFIRIRVGIAPTSFWTGKVKRPASGGPLERFVLARFSRRDERELQTVVEHAENAIRRVVTDGVARAMNEFNR